MLTALGIIVGITLFVLANLITAGAGVGLAPIVVPHSPTPHQ